MEVKPPNTMTPDQHTQTSQTFIQQAVIELADDDLLQSSEKTWGAAAHAIKSIAGRRGWQHDSHRLLFTAADRIARENSDPEIASLFRVASGAHKNFYRGSLYSLQVETNISKVEKLLAILDSIRR